MFEIDRRRNDPIADGQGAGSHFHRPGAAKQMASHRFRGADRNLLSLLFAPNHLNCFRLSNVAESGRRCVGINVIDIAWRKLGVIERELHRARSAFTVIGWRGHVMRVGGKSVARQLAINFSAAFLGMLEFFDHGNARSFAHHKTVAVAIERP